MNDDEPSYLMSQAQRCRRLARAIDDERARHALNQMADEYEARSRLIVEQRTKLPPQS